MPKKGQLKDRVGMVFKTKEGYNIKIIEYFGSDNCTIEFEDARCTILYKRTFYDIKNGKVINPNHPSVCGIGYLGIGNYKFKNDKKQTKASRLWRNILKRCYNEKSLICDKSYKDKYVCKEWHNFQNFAEWCEQNWKVHMDETWHLDKDILQKGNKIYSPETCCFVPVIINNAFLRKAERRGKYPIGVTFSKKKNKLFVAGAKGKLYFEDVQEAFDTYKIRKEKELKILADEWQPLIDPKVYKAMYNYQVEITD